MPDWKKAAQAMGYAIPDAQLEAITPALDGLEKVFRPLPATLTAEDDPAPLFSAFPDDER
jgi:hypothetical protein